MTWLLGIFNALSEIISLFREHLKEEAAKEERERQLAAKRKKEKEDEIDAAAPPSRASVIDWLLGGMAANAGNPTSDKDPDAK